MLCASISRWKFQRSSIGKLPASACCLIADCSATTAMLAASTAASASSVPRSSVQSCAGATAASQSTILPIMLKSSASKTPIAAVSSVIASRYLRSPREQAQRKAAKPRGGVAGGASGKGSTSRSNQGSTGVSVGAAPPRVAAPRAAP